MTLANQEISTDYDLDYDDNDPLGDLDRDLAECNALSNELDQLMQSTVAVERYGMSRTSFAIMGKADLLSGTALESLGIESFTGGDAAHPDSQMALEALGDVIKEKMAAWGARILNFAKTSGAKIVGVLTTIKTKIFDAGQALITKTWNGAKAAGRVIKAHPFKTIAAVLAAVVAVAAIVVMATTPGAYANESALRSMMYKLQDGIRAIKWPFGKVTANVVEGTATKVDAKSYKLMLSFAGNNTGAAAETVEKLGWSQTAVKAILGQMNRAWSAIKTSVSNMAGPIVNIVKKVDDLGGEANKVVGEKVTEKTGSKLAGWAANKWVEKLYTTALFAVIGVIYKLVSAVVVKGFRLVQSTFTELEPVVEEKAS